jgi:CDGSH-type Zn-finger protein/uncharacterized Fe-S cluster protein YjdI
MKKYEGGSADITFDSVRCIHARECVRGLPAVFDADRRPWVDPEGASADEIAAVVRRCPTGALHAIRKDGGAEEAPGPATIAVGEDGPLWVRGAVVVENNDGAPIARDTRVALCRCGQSRHKPLCDGAHTDAEFTAPGCGSTDPGNGAVETPSDPEELTFHTVPDGPLLVSGEYRLHRDDEKPSHEEGGALCRCGSSRNKPFCDGSHKRVEFRAE